MAGIIIISNNNDWDFVGRWVNHKIVCFKHWDKRRNPERYQLAVGIDIQKNPCEKCLKEGMLK